MTAAFPEVGFQVNRQTGSLLALGKPIDAERIIAVGQREKLFSVETRPRPAKAARRNLIGSITDPMHAANDQLQRWTGGRVDLPGAVFLSLLAFGIVELIRGKWRTPPWYTAFWYAFGLYSKSLIDSSLDAVDADPGSD
jgi:hypothetical protein